MAALQKLIYRGVQIGYIDMRRKAESAPFVRIHCTAELSEPIRQSMGWSVGEGQASGKFLGTVNAVAAIFSAQQKKLPGMEVDEVQIECHEVNEFSFTEVKDKNGNRAGMKLHFVLRSNDPEAESKMGQYWRQIMGNESQLKVTYSAIGKQTNLDEANEEDREPVAV